MPTIAVVGAGKVGTALAMVLQKKSYRVMGACCRTEQSVRQAAALLGCPIFSNPWDTAKTANIVLITTPDRVIEPVCREIAMHNGFHRGQVVLHTSGAHSSALLEPAREQGAAVLSMHPLQTFPSVEAGINNIKGSYFTLEGDRTAVATGWKMVEALGGLPLSIPTAMKPLYHAAACVACNYFVAIIDLALQIMEEVGVDRRQALPALLPLIEGTLNNIRRVGVPEALTGPVERGDSGTVTDHLMIIKKVMPQILELYSCLGMFTAGVAGRKGTLDQAGQEEFRGLFFDAVKQIQAMEMSKDN